ncbi:MAG: hypothetical protein AAF985_10930 [Bacteroidota bacterium]
MKREQMVFCISESAYDLHLTKGKEYKIYAIGTGSKEGKIRIKGKMGRLVWIPELCFSLKAPPTISSIIFEDELENHQMSFTDVTIELDHNEKRWLTFITLKQLDKSLNDHRDYISGNKLILLRAITKANIIKIIDQLDRQGEIIENSTLLIS